MSNYVNEISIHGLMNRTAFIDDSSPFLSFYKKKDKSKITVCRCLLPEHKEKEFAQINYMYLDEDPKIKGSYSKQNVLSLIDTGYFTGMVGNKYRKIRHAVNVNKDRIRVEPLTTKNVVDVVNMIDRWRYEDGYHYRWQEHAGIDKSLVLKIVQGEAPEEIVGFVFYYNTLCIGCSTINLKPEFDKRIPEFIYMTRKVLAHRGIKHLTEFVDWYTFSQIYNIWKRDFIINWGCSDGGVYWYKITKWPLYDLIPNWFVTIKNNF